ncbi:MAG: 2-amino-4-hydroxy-6-hydroxymethyldihydropteridine diphosphokinase [Verrucomicrobiota bacterium]|nr:2-amino-4-hydroxy-6-hydroxymethyldihydropteridine diphosphokinase [Verrucomicrobiota bacterium]
MASFNQYAFIALGSNIGHSRAILREAAHLLASFSSTPLVASSIWKTTPVDCPPGSPDFFNAVVGIRPVPALSPEELLEKLQEIERAFGRVRKTVLNEARPLDLDILFFRGETKSTQSLILPHPRAHQRKFVLAPLAEIAPELELVDRKTVSQFLSELKSGEQISRLEPLIES